MATELNMPQMGYDMQEGTVVRWLKSEGAKVKVGEAIAEIETDKAIVEYESLASGILRKILAPEGTTVPVGKLIGLITDADEDLPVGAYMDSDESQHPAPNTEAVTSKATRPTSTRKQDEVVPAPVREAKASPVARKIAEEKGFSLQEIIGTGPKGRISRDDVLAFEASLQKSNSLDTNIPPPTLDSDTDTLSTHQLSEPTSSKQLPGTTMPLTRMRKQIARVTVSSKQNAPHFYISADVDMTQAMELRRQVNSLSEETTLHITVNDLIIQACIFALQAHPKFNASFTNDSIQMNREINIGIAIAEEEGLIVPAIMNCVGKSLKGIAGASKDLAERAKKGTLHPQEYSGGTFSISNLGMFDVSSFIAIIQPPQSAMLAVGRVSKKPVVKDGQLAVADMMTATLSADHRVVDGAEGAEFIAAIKRLLESPARLLM